MKMAHFLFAQKSMSGILLSKQKLKKELLPSMQMEINPADGDTVTLIKDLKVKGAPKDLKQGTVLKISVS